MLQIGYPLVIFMSGLQRIDPELYEAAALDGATWFQRFRKITTPLLRPELYVVVLTTTIFALKVFGPIYAMTLGGPGTATIVASYFAYKNFFERSQVGYGAAISTVLTALILLIAVFYVRVQMQPGRTGEPIAMTARIHARTRIANWTTIAALALLLVIMVGPLLLVATNSFKTEAEYAQGGPLALPHGFSLESMMITWNRVDYTTKLMNSLIISSLSALLAIAISLFNAFALGIGRMRGATFFLVFFIVAITLPNESLIYPLYYMFKTVGFYDTRLSVIIVLAALNSAFGTYLLTSIFRVFPRQLLDAALIDGAGRLQLLWHMVIPISLPSLSVLFVFFFIWTWNEFFLPLIFLISNGKQTVPLAIALARESAVW